jgi:hypothetical protein
MKNKKNLMNMRIKKKRIVKQIYIVLASILCMLCIMSCDNRQSTEMIYSVNTLNAPISCVSSAKNGHYYVGFENGNIARVETNDNSWNIIHGKYIARIYDIVEENDTTLWVGIRDKGLVKMVRDSIVTTYSIGKNYAPYDICKNEKGDVYIATSSGIYQLVDDSLILISTEEKYKEYKINQLCIYNDSMLYAATEKGVLILKKKNEKYETSLIDLIPEGIIFHFHRSKDLLYATSEEKVYVIDMKTAQAKPVETKSEDNLFAYFTETVDTNAHWELTATSMNYWDKNGCSSFLIPGRLNRSYKNYIFILNDDFIILSFEYQLYTISRHQNTKGESVHVIATHIYKDSIKNSGKDILYFITNDNYLYSCPLTHSELIPKKIGKHKLEIDEVIIKLGSSKYFLWVITNNCLRQIDRKTGKLITCIEFDNGTDLRCMYVDSKCLFIGSRKWLFRINNPDNRKITKEAIDTLKTNASIRDADLYVTDIYKKINGFYFATLNNGLCILNSDTVTPINSYKDVGNINKIGYLMNVGVYLYTSTGFLLQKQNVNEKNNITFKNIPIIDYHNQYISTILERKIDGGLFVIGYKGIGMVNFEMDTFSEAAKMSFLDMQFKDAAISEYNETLFLGDRTGIYRYNYGNNASLIPVKIPEPFHVPNIILIPVIVIIVILLISLCLYFFVTKYIKKKEIIDQNKKLISRTLETIEKYRYLSNDLIIKEKLEKIESELGSISIASSYDILDEIINISEQLFDIIDEYLPKHYKDLEKKLEEDLKKIEDLVNTTGSSYQDLKPLCNTFIKEYYQVFLSEFKFMEENNRIAFNTILICTELKNKDIDSILGQQGKDSKFRNASVYYDDIESKCMGIKSNYFIDKLLNRIKDRRRNRNENKNTNENTNENENENK